MDNLDTFDSPADVSSALDTFDDGNYTTDDGEIDVQDQESQSDQEDGQGSKGAKKVDTNSQVAALEDQEEKAAEREKEDSEGDKKSDDSDEESENSETDDADAQPEAPAFEGKAVKIFKDGKAFEVPQDGAIRVKVDGKNEVVPVQELINNYSGKQSWDKKFTELSNEKASYVKEKQQYEEEKNYIATQIQSAREIAVKALQGETAPIDFVNNLLDLMNIDQYNFNKSLRQQLFQEFEVYADMTEAEREAYELRQKNAFLERKHETSREQFERQKAQEELEFKVANLRQTHGVSEEQFVSALNDLTELGMADPSPEQIVRYAAMVEPTQTAESLVKPYLDQMSDEAADKLIVSIAKELYEDKSLTPEQVKQYLAEEFEVDSIVSELNERASAHAGKPVKGSNTSRNSSNGVESFDDFDW
jgi:hypothetical protein